MLSKLLSILKEEVKPALGCTGPTSVSFAASVARDAVGGTPQSVKIAVDRDTYKNSISVGIPGVQRRGVVFAAALGALYGDSKAGLEVLKNVKPGDEERSAAFCDQVTLDILWDFAGVGVYIEVWVKTENGVGHAIVAKTHTNVVLVEANGKKLYGTTVSDDCKQWLNENQDAIREYTLKDFYTFATTVKASDLSFLQEAVTLNRQLAQAGLKEKMGGGFGRAFGRLSGNKAYLKAKMYTAAASDARMSGENLAAMSCASSGNVGIAASLPLVAIQEEYQKSDEALLRAICLSYLITIYVKSHIGRLSALCACATAASLGVAAGTVLLLDGGFAEIDMAIRSVIGSIGGVLCDGAKYGCALKLSTAGGIAFEAANLAMQGVSVPAGDGLVSASADATIQMLGELAVSGMIDADKAMCKLIIQREQAEKK